MRASGHAVLRRSHRSRESERQLMRYSDSRNHRNNRQLRGKPPMSTQSAARRCQGALSIHNDLHAVSDGCSKNPSDKRSVLHPLFADADLVRIVVFSRVAYFDIVTAGESRRSGLRPSISPACSESAAAINSAAASRTHIESSERVTSKLRSGEHIPVFSFSISSCSWS
jgi:hypothetical protein